MAMDVLFFIGGIFVFIVLLIWVIARFASRPRRRRTHRVDGGEAWIPGIGSTSSSDTGSGCHSTWSGEGGASGGAGADASWSDDGGDSGGDSGGGDGGGGSD